MIVTTISKSYINSITLPEKIKGQFGVYELSDSGEERLVNIEGSNNEWVMKSTRFVKIVDVNNDVLKSIVIQPQNRYILEKKNGEKVFIVTEPITEPVTEPVSEPPSDAVTEAMRPSIM